MKAVAKTVEPAGDREARLDNIRPLYLEALTLVERLHCRLAGRPLSSLHRRRNGFDHDTSPVVVLSTYFDETFVSPDSLNLRGAV